MFIYVVSLNIMSWQFIKLNFSDIVSLEFKEHAFSMKIGKGGHSVKSKGGNKKIFSEKFVDFFSFDLSVSLIFKDYIFGPSSVLMPVRKWNILKAFSDKS